MAIVPKAQSSVDPRISPVVGRTPAAYITNKQTYDTAAWATADAFGAAMARGQIEAGKKLIDFGDTIGALAVKLQEDDNERETKELLTQFTATKNQIGFGDGKEDTGFYGKNGQAAVDAVGPTKEALAKLQRDLAAKASNGRVRTLFKEKSDTELQQEFATIGRFTIREREVAYEAASKGRMAVATNDALLNPERLDKSIQTIQAEAMQLAERKGFTDPAAMASFMREAQTPVIQGAINDALAKEDTVRAEALMARYGALMEGSIRTQLQAKMRDQVDTRTAQTVADRAYELFPRDVEKARQYIKDTLSGKARDAALEKLNGDLGAARSEVQFGLSLEAAARARREEARAIENDAERKKDRAALGVAQKVADDVFREYAGQPVIGERIITDRLRDNPKALDLALTEFRQSVTTVERQEKIAQQKLERNRLEGDRADKEAVKKAEERAFQLVEEQKRPYSELDFETRQLLDRAGKTQHYLTREKQIASGEPNVTTPEGFKELTRFLQSNTDERANGFDRFKMRTLLDKSDYATFERLQLAAIEGRDNIRDTTTVSGYLSARMFAEFGNPKELSNAQQKRQKEIFVAATNEIEEAQKAKKGVRLSWDEKRQIIDSFFDTKVQVPTTFGFGTKELSVSKLKTTDIPENYVKSITQQYQQRYGRVPNSVEIVRTYSNILRNREAQKQGK